MPDPVAAIRRDVVLSAVVRVLAPLLGASMASASARMHMDKLGFTALRLERAEVERLLDALGPGLNVFLGRRKTEEALLDIKRALDGSGGER